jgi:hypothetical protein
MREPGNVLVDAARSVVANLTSGAVALNATVTVTGELISVWCYIQNARNVGDAGYLCALADLKWEANPPGILTSDGKVYQLAGSALGENNSKAVAYIGKTVTATGDVVEKDGVRIMNASELKVQG